MARQHNVLSSDLGQAPAKAIEAVADLVALSQRQWSRITEALLVISAHGMSKKAQHKQWALDQMVQELLGPDGYAAWVKEYNDQSHLSGDEDWSTGEEP